MIIQADTILKDFAGKELKQDGENLTLGKALSNCLLTSKEGGKMKLYLLAQKLFSQDKVEVDESDFNLIKNCAERSEIYNALVAGQIQLLLSEIK